MMIKVNRSHAMPKIRIFEGEDGTGFPQPRNEAERLRMQARHAEYELEQVQAMLKILTESKVGANFKLYSLSDAFTAQGEPYMKATSDGSYDYVDEYPVFDIDEEEGDVLIDLPTLHAYLKEAADLLIENRERRLASHKKHLDDYLAGKRP